MQKNAGETSSPAFFNTFMEFLNYHSEDLTIDRFTIATGEAWCILGSNNSGIDKLVHLFTADNSDAIIAEKTAVVSFAKQQLLFEEELKKDDTDFLNRLDPGTPARAFLDKPEQYSDLIKAFNFDDCLEKGYKHLSTGESRKLLLLSSICSNTEIILIENPYDGLDATSCKELDNTLQALHKLGRKIIVTVNNYCDIPKWCSHLAVLEEGTFVLRGKREDILKEPLATLKNKTSSNFVFKSLQCSDSTGLAELIALKHGCVSYDGTAVFSNLNVTIYKHQHTLVTGPNGSGKSTLLQIITGDNQKCYSNNLRIFGIQRGTGESIWELKKQMGIVSPDLHRNHYIPGSALQVVLSGFFDSIGVYKKFSESKRKQALAWLNKLGLKEKAQISFRQLSYAEQRLCLIARALIKIPQLLILDEPTQGLDQENRDKLLNFLEQIALNKMSTIIYASHRSDEFRPFFTQHIDLSNLS